MNNLFVGINELDKVLNEFVNPFGTYVEFGSEFIYWVEEEKIEYSLIMPEQGRDYFMENFRVLAPDIQCDPFLASFMHELGHHMTNDLFDDDDEAAFIYDTRQYLAKALNDKTDSEEELYKLYFNLPDEMAATYWAIAYMREHSKKVAEFWDKVQNTIMNFYKLNGIEVSEVADC